MHAGIAYTRMLYLWVGVRWSMNKRRRILLVLQWIFFLYFLWDRQTKYAISLSGDMESKKFCSHKELDNILYNTDVGREYEQLYDEFDPLQNFITYVHSLLFVVFLCIWQTYTHNICFIIRSVIVLNALGWPVSHTKQMSLYVVKHKRQHSGMAT